MVFIHVFPIQMECDIQMIMEIWIHTNLSSLLSISHIGRWDPRQTKNWIREKVGYFIQKLQVEYFIKECLIPTGNI